MNSDSDIASRMKTIYIENRDRDGDSLDHFGIDWQQFCEILFEKTTDEKEGSLT